MDKTVRVWDAEAGAEVGRFVHPSAVMSVAVSPDGRRVYSASYDKMTAGEWMAKFGEFAENA
eukprot:gene9334-15120_t